MKIEKISESQIKFILTKCDLEERGISINELTCGSDKTHQLFQDMMRRANAECDFNSENTPLMVEAMSTEQNNVIIMVTKMADSSDLPLELLTRAKEALLRHLASKCLNTEADESTEAIHTETIFSFEDIDTAAFAAGRLRFSGQSRLYKHNGRVFLALQCGDDDDSLSALEEAERILYEYGDKHVSNAVSRTYLDEHAEIIIGADALEKLSVYAGTFIS